MSNMKKRNKTIILWLLAAVASLGLAVYLFFTYVGGVNRVVGRSMEPALLDGSVVYVSRWPHDIETVTAGKVIVYHLPRNNADFIGRIIATEGQTVKIDKGAVYVNDKEYIVPEAPNVVTAAFSGGFMKTGVAVTVPTGSVFVLGDNRMRSADSRDFGFIKKVNIESVYQFCYSECQ